MREYIEEKLVINTHYDEIIGKMLQEPIFAEPNIGKLADIFDETSFLNLDSLREKYGDRWVKISEILRDYLMQKNGKHLRPLLVLLGYKMFSHNKKPEKEIINKGVGVELLHETALILDDVMDNAVLRRGAPSLWASVASQMSISNNEAKKIAVELAPLCFAWSRFLIIDECEESIKPEIEKIFWRVIEEMKRGQVLDINSANKNEWPKLEDAIECEYLKTATYSMELPLLISFCSAGVLESEREKNIENIKMFARGFGLAFQLQDDLLIMRTGQEIGKESMSDAVNGNKIPLAIIARQLGSDEQKKFLDLVWGHPENLTTENTEKLKNIFTETGALQKITQIISEELENAKGGLNKIKENGFDTDPLNYLITLTI